MCYIHKERIFMKKHQWDDITRRYSRFDLIREELIKHENLYYCLDRFKITWIKPKINQSL